MNRDEILYGSPEQHTDSTKLILTAEQILTARNAAKEITGHVNRVVDHASRNILRVDIRYNCLSLVRNFFNKMAVALGHDEDISADEANQTKIIQALNEELREIKAKMGQDLPIEGISHKLYEMHSNVYEYWKSLGFLNLEGEFIPNSRNTYFKAEFSLIANRMDDEGKAIDRSAKEGLQIITKEHDSDVIDSTENKNWIVNKLRAKFPSFTPNFWEVFHKRANGPVLWKLKGTIDASEMQ